ncbi:hypothetical protein CTI12_AA444220 [Artemisia annua]|uniref:Zinc finger GRF-type domain-containing protein n=1 Tax=Artemisia annua TaxID=35608 RepID=A0A2U1LX25_ARTAN|nr:hypothetical protein CTI12_AA444220 [Artemisia annua]
MSSSSNRSYRLPPPTYCEHDQPVIRQTSRSIDFPLRRFLGCVEYYNGSKCKTFYWLDPELPNNYYKQEFFKLIQKEKRLKEDKYSFNGKIRDLERDIDFQKSTMEKEMFLLQLELKESKSSVLLMFAEIVMGKNRISQQVKVNGLRPKLNKVFAALSYKFEYK